MFIGHFGLGLATKRVTPEAPLWLLFLAAQLADVLWPVLLAAGAEQVVVRANDNPLLRLDFVHYPYSHSLLLLVVWGFGLGIAGRTAFRSRRLLAALAALVVSHWALDWIAHRPDLPLYPGGPRFGLGLWNSIAATLVVEVALFSAGLWLYMRAARRWQPWRPARLLTLAGFLLIGYVASLIGPPPPSVSALYGTAIALFAIVLAWSWWAEKA